MVKENTFVPKEGQIDFTKARWAPVVNCVLKYENKILIVQRSESLNFYPGYWNGISGFLDDQRSLKQKVEDEIKEELGMKRKELIQIIPGEIFDQEASKYKKTWIVHPVLVKVKTDKISLDWEAQKYLWTTISQALQMKLLPGFDEVLKRIARLR